MTTPAPDVAPTMAQLAFGDLAHEMQQTRRILERVPDAQLGFRPHAKSWTLGEIATHIANLPTWGSSILAEDRYDLATATRKQAATSREALLADFDANAAALQAAIEGATDARLMATWTLVHGDHVILAMPSMAAIRSVVLSHMIHHRGQLSVYLRLTDTPVPGLYGPSADD